MQAVTGASRLLSVIISHSTQSNGVRSQGFVPTADNNGNFTVKSDSSCPFCSAICIVTCEHSVGSLGLAATCVESCSNVSAYISVAIFRVKQAEEGYGVVCRSRSGSLYAVMLYTGRGGSKFAFKLTSEQFKTIFTEPPLPNYSAQKNDLKNSFIFWE
jgi:hypothetical protein